MPPGKGSWCQRRQLSDPKQMHQVLETVLGIRGVVRKKRILYLLDETRIHLDQVDGLGSFVEFEVVLDGPGQGEYGAQKARHLLKILDIEPGALLEGSYIDLISQNQNGEGHD